MENYEKCLRKGDLFLREIFSDLAVKENIKCAIDAP